MIEPRYTPGPWALNRTITSGNQTAMFSITGPRDGSLSPVCYGAETGYGGEMDANGRLIAAAPELLEAALNVNALSIQTDAHKRLRAAIEKALGNTMSP